MGVMSERLSTRRPAPLRLSLVRRAGCTIAITSVIPLITMAILLITRR
jgi:hypothetical protein